MKTQESNRLSEDLDKIAKRSILSMLSFIEKQITKLKKDIALMVKSNKGLKEQVSLLTSIAGVGDKTAWSLFAYFGDISLFDHAKQVTSYAGLNSRIEQSGTSLNRTRVSKMGHARVRKSLYMPTLVSVRFNSTLLAFYQRLLQRGKAKKVALIAAMRKLLVLAYGEFKSGKTLMLIIKINR